MTGDPGGTEDEPAVLALLAALALLALVLLIGRALHHARVTWIGEAGAALLVGLLVGLLIRVSHAGEAFQSSITFNKFIFLNILLPTIMFDAGYSLDPKPFIRNVGSVCVIAFLGTTISTFVVGGILYGVGAAGLAKGLPLIYNLIFGAIISATDPVTVLAVLSNLGANEDLYINVFGESVLNDAVALVLYDTLRGFVGKTITAGDVFQGIGLFVGIFLGSVAMGLATGFLLAFLFRTGWIQDRVHPEVETGIVVVTAFLSYLCAEAAHMSGICSVLFCGMVIRSFVSPNLSHHSQLRVEASFKTLSSLFELFLFVYIGLTLFLVPEEFNIWPYAGWTLLALAVSRALNIFPCAALVNWLRLPQYRMSFKQQFMQWWSGLRGAMAFALAVDAADIYGEPGAVMKTCTFYVVLLTVLVNGGSSAYLLKKLHLLRSSAQPVPTEDSDDGNGSRCIVHLPGSPGGAPDVECAELLTHPEAAYTQPGSAATMLPPTSDEGHPLSHHLAHHQHSVGGAAPVTSAFLQHSYSLRQNRGGGTADGRGMRARGSRSFGATNGMAAGCAAGTSGLEDGDGFKRGALRTSSEALPRTSPPPGLRAAGGPTTWKSSGPVLMVEEDMPGGMQGLQPGNSAAQSQPGGAGPSNQRPSDMVMMLPEQLGQQQEVQAGRSGSPELKRKSTLHRVREFNSSKLEQKLGKLSRMLDNTFRRAGDVVSDAVNAATHAGRLSRAASHNAHSSSSIAMHSMPVPDAPQDDGDAASGQGPRDRNLGSAVGRQSMPAQMPGAASVPAPQQRLGNRPAADGGTGGRA